MKKLAIALAAAGTLVAGQAFAVPAFTLVDGYTGAIKIKFSNWENFTTAPGATPAAGDVNYGIIKITSIESDDGNNTPLWSSGQNGAELTGVFGGVTLSSVTTIPGGLDLQATGGVLDIYINPVNSFASAGGANQGTGGYAPAGCGVGGQCYNGISNIAGGGLFLSLAWASGINPLDSTVTVDGSLDGSTLPGTGDAGGFMDVVGGLYASKFDSNGQPTAFGNRDLFVQNDFCTNGQVGCGVPAQGNWQLLSEDPARASVVPEPGSLALIGLSLFGLAAFGRRKNV